MTNSTGPESDGKHLREADSAGYGGRTLRVTTMNTHIDRITVDPTVMGGRPCIRGLRVTVGTIVGLVAAGRARDEILSMYPYLEGEDIRAALEYAAWRVDEIERPFSTRSA